MEEFDPNGVGNVNGGIFGLPYEEEEAQIILMPVPWEVTVSYNAGTLEGPNAIRKASPQLDLYDFDVADAWKKGYHMLEEDSFWRAKNNYMRAEAKKYIEFLEEGGDIETYEPMQHILKQINESCNDLRVWIKTRATEYLEKGKIVGIVGGDHSTPLGLIEALAARHEEMGILQIDAHADLRVAYEGFTYSHASIMYNAMQQESITKLVSVGVRDICEAEMNYSLQSNGRIVPFYGPAIRRRILSENSSWILQCREIINQLPEMVYVSFDIDGLDPKLCPHTGTPVPDGMEMGEIFMLLSELIDSGRKIIGFDLCEVAPGDGPNEWDANVGARVLYKLCNLTAKSNALENL